MFLIILLVIVVILRNLIIRYKNSSHQNDIFAQHFNIQQKKLYFSGMHQPLMPTEQQRAFFEKHFSEYHYLLPDSLATLQKKLCTETPIVIKPLTSCPVPFNEHEAKSLAVGGISALLWATSRAQQNEKLIYLNNEQSHPIAYGSAFRLEEDAASEAPTGYHPFIFLLHSLFIALVNPKNFLHIEKTGFFPWRTLDWIAWLRHPGSWWIGLKIFYYFQKLTLQSKSKRRKMIQDVVTQCRLNTRFYNQLNELFSGKLIFPEKGSILIARTKKEIKEYYFLHKMLKNENRTLNFLSQHDLKQTYGFSLKGKLFVAKLHDRTLSPHVFTLLKNYLKQQGAHVINSQLKAIYVDTKKTGGVAEYINQDGEIAYLSFSKIILSLGQQAIIDINKKHLFDITSARGVSMLAYLYVPFTWKLPSAIVCGETNHVTILSQHPVPLDDHRSVYLIRITAGACITPTVFEKSSVNYDASTALGLIGAVRNALGSDCTVEPIFVYGCNRQISRFGQTHWINPYPGIHIHYGAGGGGLTRAPEAIRSV